MQSGKKKMKPIVIELDLSDEKIPRVVKVEVRLFKYYAIYIIHLFLYTFTESQEKWQ